MQIRVCLQLGFPIYFYIFPIYSGIKFSCPTEVISRKATSDVSIDSHLNSVPCFSPSIFTDR